MLSLVVEKGTDDDDDGGGDGDEGLAVGTTAAPPPERRTAYYVRFRPGTQRWDNLKFMYVHILKRGDDDQPATTSANEHVV